MGRCLFLPPDISEESDQLSEKGKKADYFAVYLADNPWAPGWQWQAGMSQPFGQMGSVLLHTASPPQAPHLGARGQVCQLPLPSSHPERAKGQWQ